MIALILAHLGLVSGGAGLAAMVVSHLFGGSIKYMILLAGLLVLASTFGAMELRNDDLKLQVAKIQPQLDEARKINAENLDTIAEVMNNEKASVKAITDDRDRTVAAVVAGHAEQKVVHVAAQSCVGPVHPAISAALSWVRSTASDNSSAVRPSTNTRGASKLPARAGRSDGSGGRPGSGGGLHSQHHNGVQTVLRSP